MEVGTDDRLKLNGRETMVYILQQQLIYQSISMRVRTLQSSSEYITPQCICMYPSNTSNTSIHTPINSGAANPNPTTTLPHHQPNPPSPLLTNPFVHLL